MAKQKKPYADVLRTKVNTCLRALAAGDFAAVANERLEESIADSYFDDESDEASQDFLDVLAAMTGAADGDSALDALTTLDFAQTGALECQLQLLRAFAALENRDECDFVGALSDLLENACLYIGDDVDRADRVFASAITMHRDDGFRTARLSLRAVRHFIDCGATQKAKEWLQRVPVDSLGPYEPVYRAINAMLEE